VSLPGCGSSVVSLSPTVTAAPAIPASKPPSTRAIPLPDRLWIIPQESSPHNYW